MQGRRIRKYSSKLKKFGIVVVAKSANGWDLLDEKEKRSKVNVAEGVENKGGSKDEKMFVIHFRKKEIGKCLDLLSRTMGIKES